MLYPEQEVEDEMLYPEQEVEDDMLYPEQQNGKELNSCVSQIDLYLTSIICHFRKLLLKLT